MRTIEHTVDIPAPAGVVWDVLTDTAHYEEWNPFIPRLDGPLRVGERITVSIRPRGRAMTFTPVVVALEPGRLVRWRGRLLVRGLFDGVHEFRLGPTPDGGTRFTQSERFSGVLVPFVRGVLRDTAAGFAAMDDALRDRVARALSSAERPAARAATAPTSAATAAAPPSRR